MADTALKGSTIAASYDWLVFRGDAYSDLGNKINFMNDSGVIKSSPLYVGVSPARVGIGISEPGSTLEVAATASEPTIELSCWSTTDSHTPKLVFQKSGHATIGTLTPTEDDENLGEISFWGVDNAGTPAIKKAAYIRVAQDSAKDNDSVPARMTFATSDTDDNGTPTSRITIVESGNVGIGTDSPDVKFEIDTGDCTDNVRKGIAYFRTFEANPTSSMFMIKGGRDDDADTHRYIELASTLSNGSTTVPLYLNAKNVGIGTTSPATPLHLYQAATDAAAPLEILRLECKDEGVEMVAGMGSKISFFQPSGNSATPFEGAFIGAQMASSGDANESTDLVFATTADTATTATVKMTIDSNGNVGIKDTAPTEARLVVEEDTGDNKWVAQFRNNDGDEPLGIQIYHSGYESSSDDSADHMFISCVDNDASTEFAVYGDGDVFASDSEVHASDVRIKRDIVDATSKLSDLNKLKVRNYRYKTADGNVAKGKKGIKRIGFVADELEAIFPSLITKRKMKYLGVEWDDLKQIRWDALLPIMVKAIQELSSKVETLENA